jgi:hypothetical protein
MLLITIGFILPYIDYCLLYTILVLYYLVILITFTFFTTHCMTVHTDNPPIKMAKAVPASYRF